MARARKTKAHRPRDKATVKMVRWKCRARNCPYTTGRARDPDDLKPVIDAHLQIAHPQAWKRRQKALASKA